jgi:hypothetical protein
MSAYLGNDVTDAQLDDAFAPARTREDFRADRRDPCKPWVSNFPVKVCNLRAGETVIVDRYICHSGARVLLVDNRHEKAQVVFESGRVQWMKFTQIVRP